MRAARQCRGSAAAWTCMPLTSTTSAHANSSGARWPAMFSSMNRTGQLLGQIGGDEQQALRRHERAHAFHQVVSMIEGPEGWRVARENAQDAAPIVDRNGGAHANLRMDCNLALRRVEPSTLPRCSRLLYVRARAGPMWPASTFAGGRARAKPPQQSQRLHPFVPAKAGRQFPVLDSRWEFTLGRAPRVRPAAGQGVNSTGVRGAE